MHARVRVCSFKHRDDQFVNNTIRRFPSFSLPGDSFDPPLISRVVIWTRLAPSTPLSVPFLPLHNLNPSLTCPPLLLLFSLPSGLQSPRALSLRGSGRSCRSLGQECMAMQQIYRPFMPVQSVSIHVCCPCAHLSRERPIMICQ